MTKKHYQIFAELIKNRKNDEKFEQFFNEFVKLLKNDNPKFNEETFRTASGMILETTISR